MFPFQKWAFFFRVYLYIYIFIYSLSLKKRIDLNFQYNTLPSCLLANECNYDENECLLAKVDKKVRIQAQCVQGIGHSRNVIIIHAQICVKCLASNYLIHLLRIIVFHFSQNVNCIQAIMFFYLVTIDKALNIRCVH